jgi:hypothetical protein
MYPWENTVLVKPWEYRCTVTLACLDTPDDVAAVVRLWRAQTVRPYIMVIDTGSTPDNLNKLLALRAHDLEVHCLQPNGLLHPCDAPAIACSLAADLCRTKYLIFTHSDVYPCRRDIVEELVGLCETKSPVVGYAISKPRPYEVQDTWVGHQLTCVDVDALEEAGCLDFNQRRLCRLFGIEDQRPNPALRWFPDTELLLNFLLDQAGIVPHMIGEERVGGVYVDDRIEHVRALTNSKNFGYLAYHEKAQGWAADARQRANARLSLWTTGKPLLNVVTACCRPENIPALHAGLEQLRTHYEVVWYVAADTSKVKVSDIPTGPEYCLAVPEPGGWAQRNVALRLIRDGWVYFLDDDNLIHPDFAAVSSHYLSQYPDAKAFVYNQMEDGRERLRTGAWGVVEFGKIDTGSFLIHKSAVGDAQWVNEPGLADDYCFIRDVYANCPQDFRFVDRWVTNYNALRKTSMMCPAIAS